ncbi:hypothetical protein AMATHDRAFT_38092 [Amanita thiersii Skay4041]|uniref:Uncharacterized protein n=1 Tax=Amanita thiersii Skay4041 TaxID=703135 RepID=A0A2A9P1Z4_9AGAR|nr:hypothetical protein AMATHDRAFT_38092 [Amanita thiersii Skay4041]
MSFQHFRLGDISLHQQASSHLTQHHNHHPSPPPLPLYQPTVPLPDHDQDKSQPSSVSSRGNKQPYGSGDTDDGYTLVFSNLAAFERWRAAEEEEQMVEFVKARNLHGDTHGSKAVPPRFKDHTKLVCARHSRSGRKKYIKKYPERVRKVPSRKLDGMGCPACISYKTYFDTEQVRACYLSQHSHPIGPANLPFTRRGRKAQAILDKQRTRPNPSPLPPPPPPPPPPPLSHSESDPPLPLPSSSPPPPPSLPETHSPSDSASPPIAPLQTQSTFQQHSSPSFVYSAPVSQPFISPQNLSHDRWENMSTLFHSVRENARAFDYPAVSIAALESILIRLYLESPMSFTPQPTMGAVMQHVSGQTRALVPSSVGDSHGANVANGHEENGT